MSKYMIRVDAEVTDDLLTAFPFLVPARPRTQTTLSGEFQDQEQLTGVLNLLAEMGIPILEVVNISD